jgi:hypothetical protein
VLRENHQLGIARIGEFRSMGNETGEATAACGFSLTAGRTNL